MPLPADDPTQRKPDISLAKEKLKWEPTIALEDGLKETIEYFKTNSITQRIYIVKSRKHEILSNGMNSLIRDFL